MNWLQDLEQLVVRVACDVDRRVSSALHDLRHASLSSIPAPERSTALAPRSSVLTSISTCTRVARSRQRHGESPSGRQDARSDLTAADIQFIWLRRNQRVVSALRNFAALRFIPMPMHSAAAWEIETPLRAVVNAVGVDEGLSKFERVQVYDAVLIALVTLPLGMALPNPFGIVEELDRIIDGVPQISAAVLRVWSTVDDPMFWVAVEEGNPQLAAV